MYWYSILVYTVINTFVHFFLSNMFTIKSYCTYCLLLTVTITPFVNPSVTSILVIIITLALIFTVRPFLRLPVSHGFIDIVMLANSVQSSFLLSVAIFVNSFPGSSLSLYSFHPSSAHFVHIHALHHVDSFHYWD